MYSNDDIPCYLLDQIFIHLPISSLQTCRAVSRTWNVTILSRQALRRKLFLQPPTPGVDDVIFRQRPVNLHPIFSKLESNWSEPDVPVTLATSIATAEGYQKRLLKDSPVNEVFATEPAIQQFVLMMPTQNIVVQRSTGVTVGDVATGVKKLYEILGKMGGAGMSDSW